MAVGLAPGAQDLSKAPGWRLGPFDGAQAAPQDLAKGGGQECLGPYDGIRGIEPKQAEWLCALGRVSPRHGPFRGVDVAGGWRPRFGYGLSVV